MHFWGDDWPYWEDMNKVVDRCYELAESADLPITQIKEKYGGLRFYCPCPSTASAKAAYRNVYATLIAEFPHLTMEILTDADWFRECLVGLVDESKCDHASRWIRGDEKWCGICGKDMTDQNVNGGNK